MNAAQLNQKQDYPNFPEFAQYGIDLSLTDAETILTLQEIRNQGRFAIFPGQYQTNWGRTTGSETSEHYAVGRLATAGDVFPARGKALKFWLLAQDQEDVGGLGLYLDTKGPDGMLWLMVHFDLRPGPREFWIRDVAGQYWIERLSPIQFWRNFRVAVQRDVL